MVKPCITEMDRKAVILGIKFSLLMLECGIQKENLCRCYSLAATNRSALP